MSSFFAKITPLFALVFISITIPNYIQVASDSLTFDYKTGEVSPIIYYLNVKNIGPQKAKFIVSNNAQWLFIAREGTDFVKSVDIGAGVSVNFVLTIQAGGIADGVHKAEVSVEAVSADGYSAPYDSKKTTVTVNKNVVPTLTPEAAVTVPVLTASPALTPAAIATPAAFPTVPIVVTPKPKATPSSMPAISPTGTPAATLRVPSPFPTVKPLPAKAAPQAQARRSVLENIWSFFKGLFF